MIPKKIKKRTQNQKILCCTQHFVLTNCILSGMLFFIGMSFWSRHLDSRSPTFHFLFANIEKEKENWNRRPKFDLITPPCRGHRNKERFRERKKKEKRPRKYTSTFPVCSASAPLFHIDISIYLLSRFFSDLFFPFRLVGCERTCHNVLFHMWLSHSLLLHRSVLCSDHSLRLLSWDFITRTDPYAILFRINQRSQKLIVTFDS